MKLYKIWISVIVVALVFGCSQEIFAQAGSVSGVVFVDSDGDGEADAGEPVVPGTTVELLSNNGTVIATMVADANGQYNFTAIPPGKYRVRFTYPNGLQVQTALIDIRNGEDIVFDAPVVEATNGRHTTSPNLSLVNPGSSRGPEVSPFTP
tara:strand:- start:2683 stop:3135 length:453 start_codon:yes stop_codon:yes gene_type:complete